jgi:hypothetical protein
MLPECEYEYLFSKGGGRNPGMEIAFIMMGRFEGFKEADNDLVLRARLSGIYKKNSIRIFSGKKCTALQRHYQKLFSRNF